MEKHLVAVGTAVLLAGCGSSSAAITTSPSAAPGFPTQDVVSAIGADAKISAELPAAVRSRGTLILGTTITPGLNGLPHGGQLPDGTTVGVDVDLRQAVAKVLGIRWDVQNGTFPTIIPGVQNGKYDVGTDNFGVTGPREKVVDFATYLTDGQAFLTPADSDLSSTQVGFVTGMASPIAPALRDAVNKLIATGDYAKILGKWGVTDSGITRSAINPPSSL